MVWFVFLTWTVFPEKRQQWLVWNLFLTLLVLHTMLTATFFLPEPDFATSSRPYIFDKSCVSRDLKFALLMSNLFVAFSLLFVNIID